MPCGDERTFLLCPAENIPTLPPQLYHYITEPSAISGLFLVPRIWTFNRPATAAATDRKIVLPRHEIGTKPFKADGLERAIGFNRAYCIIEILGEIVVFFPQTDANAGTEQPT